MLLSLENLDAYQKLFGMNDRNMGILEQELSVTAMLRGQELRLTGDPENVAVAEEAIGGLLLLLSHGENIDPLRIRYAIQLAREGNISRLEELGSKDVIAFTHRGRPIRSKTLGQQAYVDAVRNHEWPWWP